MGQDIQKREIVFNEEYQLHVPTYDKRLMSKGWFKKTFDNIQGELQTSLGLLDTKRRCIQAGACLGIYPRYLSVFFDQVVSFEPNPDLYKCAFLNTADRRNVVVMRGALGEETIMQTLLRSQKTGGDSLVAVSHETLKDKVDVLVTSIDSLEFTDVDFIQLDVEGYEPFILRGAKETIDLCRPVIQVEMHKITKREIDLELVKLGYKFYAKAGSRDAVYVPEERNVLL